MRHSDDFSAVVTALVQVQAGLRRLVPDHTAKIVQRNGREFAYKHASLADGIDLLRPLLTEAKLAVIQPTSFGDGMVVVETVLAHVSGQWVAGETAVPLSEDMRGAQAVGSAITYARRYGLFALVGVVVAEEDDDGAAVAAAAATNFRRPNADWGATEKFKRTALQAINAVGTPEGLEDWWEANGAEVAMQTPDTVVEIKGAISRKHKMLAGVQPHSPTSAPPTHHVSTTPTPTATQQPTPTPEPKRAAPTPAAAPATPKAEAPKPAAKQSTKKDEPKAGGEPDGWDVFN